MSPPYVAAYNVAPQRHNVKVFVFGFKSESWRCESLDEVVVAIPCEAVARNGLRIIEFMPMISTNHYLIVY